MEKKYKQLKTDVSDEISSIEQVLEEIKNLKRDLSANNIDNVTKAAIGTFLMNYYTGVENIIKRISKEYYQTMPKGDSWHKELLDLSYNPPKDKIPIFSKDIVDRLNPYRGFRHFFISGYGFRIKLKLILSLINNIENIWKDVKQHIEKFEEKL